MPIRKDFFAARLRLLQTIGRSARNVNATVILYADTVTNSMQHAIDETRRRRAMQEEYNREHGITPTTIKKAIRAGIEAEAAAHARANAAVGRTDEAQYITEEYIGELETEMYAAAEGLEFERAGGHPRSDYEDARFDRQTSRRSRFQSRHERQRKTPPPRPRRASAAAEKVVLPRNDSTLPVGKVGRIAVSKEGSPTDTVGLCCPQGLPDRKGRRGGPSIDKIALISSRRKIRSEKQAQFAPLRHRPDIAGDSIDENALVRPDCCFGLSHGRQPRHLRPSRRRIAPAASAAGTAFDDRTSNDSDYVARRSHRHAGNVVLRTGVAALRRSEIRHPRRSGATGRPATRAHCRDGMVRIFQQPAAVGHRPGAWNIESTMGRQRLRSVYLGGAFVHFGDLEYSRRRIGFLNSPSTAVGRGFCGG